MPKRLTTAEFVTKALKKHEGYNSYPLAQYKTGKDQISVTCPVHGNFSILAESHLAGQGCKSCGYARNARGMKKTREEFIAEAMAVHGDFYDYSLVPAEMPGNRTKVSITCPIHGPFLQAPMNHKQGKGCRKCGREKARKGRSYSLAQFLDLIKQKGHSDLEFVESSWVNYTTPMSMICPNHGRFEQIPERLFVMGAGCQQCGYQRMAESKRISTEEFIRRSKELHGDRFTYELTEFRGSYSPIKVTCKKHGVIELDPAYYHMQGWGCRECGLDMHSSLGEEKISRWLEKEKIAFERQKAFPGLRRTRPLRYDFFINAWNVVIEFNGQQHYQAFEPFGGQKTLELTQESDQIKFNFAQETGLELVIIRYDDHIEDCLERMANRFR